MPMKRYNPEQIVTVLRHLENVQQPARSPATVSIKSKLSPNSLIHFDDLRFSNRRVGSLSHFCEIEDFLWLRAHAFSEGGFCSGFRSGTDLSALLSILTDFPK
jgi:hypothetical protein